MIQVDVTVYYNAHRPSDEMLSIYRDTDAGICCYSCNGGL